MTTVSGHCVSTSFASLLFQLSIYDLLQYDLQDVHHS